jgi:hypothetical protein
LERKAKNHGNNIAKYPYKLKGGFWLLLITVITLMALGKKGL